MAWTHKARHSPAPLSHRLLSHLSPDWIFKGIERFAKDRDKRLADLGGRIERLKD